jgi:hypothetical protein
MPTPYQIEDGGPIDWDCDIVYRFTADDGSEDVGTSADYARLQALYQGAGSSYIITCYYQEDEPADDDGEHPSLSAADRNPSLR